MKGPNGTASRPRWAVAARIGYVLAITALTCSSAVEAEGVLPRAQLESLLEDSTQVLQRLVSARHQHIDARIVNKEDKLGHTLKDDLEQNVMLPETEARLSGLVQTARENLRTGDLPGVQVAVTDLRRELHSEIERFQAIGEYWGQIVLVDSDTPREQAALRALGIEPPHEKEIQALSSQLDQQIAAREFVAAMHDTWPRIQNLNQAASREESRLILAALDSGRLRNVHSGMPTHNCTPATHTSGSASARVITENFPQTIDYYPEEMKQHGIEGAIEVFIALRADGCPERAIVLVSSGHVPLDDAALDMVLDGHYLPAEQDGQGVRDGIRIRVKFALGPTQRR